MKNLYAITFKHLSQKDRKEGIDTYFIGTKENILNYIINDKMYLDYEDDEDWEFNSQEELIKKVEEIIDENQSEDYPTIEDDNETFVNYDDLYYGETFWGYKLLKENISDEDVEKLKELKII